MEDRRQLCNQFLEAFPLSKLKDLTLDAYTNLNKDNSFCYWLESRTTGLGSFRGGYSFKFGIYAYRNKPASDGSVKSDDKYAWYAKYNQDTAEGAFEIVKNAIVRVANYANEGKFEEIESISELGEGYKWKIAFLYSHERLIPIYSKKMLQTLAKYFNMGINVSRVEIQKRLMEMKGEKDLYDFYDELLKILEAYSPTNTDMIQHSENLLGETDHDNSSQRQYWWLIADPKVWKFTDIAVGGVVNYTLYSDNGSKRRIFQNFLDAKEGDGVIGYASTPTLQVVALGEIAKDTDKEYLYFRKNEQLLTPIDYSVFKQHEELQGMECLKGNGRGTLFQLTADEYETIIEIVRHENPEKRVAVQSYTDEDFLSEVYMDADDLQHLKSLLRQKKNVILQGAPGVGKTFTAERLAYVLMGVKEPERIEKVQFHQSFSYEDFIMGYKPTEQGGFELRTGIFYQFCQKAKNSPDKDFFFIIDEINRGNLSKIFGELLMLIENGYRNTEINLAYTGKPFFVPDNLYIIGMMNTADRSLAMIDYALRRRFSFFEMKPGFDSAGFMRYQQKEVNNARFNQLIRAIKSLNKEIEKDHSLGSGFCIGHSYFCAYDKDHTDWLDNVVNYDIIPMLKEYWFDNEDKYQSEVQKLKYILNEQQP